MSSPEPVSVSAPRCCPGLLVLLVPLVACRKAPPPADPQFSDALVYTFRAFQGPEADLAYAIRALEEQVYRGMDVESSSPHDRALTPSDLAEEDIADIEHPDRDPAACIPVSVAGVSRFGPDDHARVQMLEDQTPVEPYSPDYFVRDWLEGQDCWQDRQCRWMRTHNDLVKDNILLTIPYEFFKDFRWVDLALPDPSTVPAGEEPVHDGEPRWAIVARSWTTQPYAGETGANVIQQSYTLEVWLPRDGRGFVRDESDGGEEEWTADSRGGGTLRMLTLWGETELGGLDVSDDLIAATTRKGIDDNFRAVEDWLEDN